jgi:hypothetical protein
MKRCQKHMVYNDKCVTCQADLYAIDEEHFYKCWMDRFATVLDCDPYPGIILEKLQDLIWNEASMKRMIASLRGKREI